MSSKKKAVVVSPAEVRIDPTQASFTIPQVAAYCGLTPWQVRMVVWKGQLPAKKIGKSLIILRADADSFLKSLPNVAASEAAWLAKRQAVKA